MSNKKLLLTIGTVLFVMGILFIAIAVVLSMNDGTSDFKNESDVTTEEYAEAESYSETLFLSEHRWIRNINCQEQITFSHDGRFSYFCSCGSPVDNYDLYDSFEYKDGVISVMGTDDEKAAMNVIYYDQYYLCLYLEAEKECRVFVDSDYASSPYAEQDPFYFASDNWLELHVLDYDSEYLKAAPYNYDGDAREEFKEYIKELTVSDDVEFYSVTSVDNKGELTTEHFKLSEEDIEFIGEYYTGGYAQFDMEGNIRYVVFYGKTVIR